jgi:hypothetical protein
MTCLFDDKGDACTVKDILGNSDLNVSVSYELPDLMEFFVPHADAEPTPDEISRCVAHFQELIDWTLTDKFDVDPLDFRLNRNASNVLSGIGHKGMRRFLDCERNPSPLIPALCDFFDTRYSESPVSCGHYSRILQAAAAATQGKVFSQFEPQNPPLLTRILCRIEELSLRDLIYQLCTDFLPHITWMGGVC